MRVAPITVVIPVGPRPHHCAWLEECIESINEQSMQPGEILLVDDMHNLEYHDEQTLARAWKRPIRVVRNVWRLGSTMSMNVGIAQAQYDLVISMASDDKFLPGAIEGAWDTFQYHNQKDAFYWFPVRYSDGREDQYLMWGGFLTTKEMWRKVGGYPPDSCFTDDDATLGSVLLQHMPGCIIGINEQHGIRQRKPLYFHRIHEHSITATSGDKFNIGLFIRHYVTENWKTPEWGRYQ